MKKYILSGAVILFIIFFLSPWLWIDNGEKIMEHQLFRTEGTNAFTQRRSNCEKEDGFTLQVRWSPFGATATHPCFYDSYIVTFWGKMIHSEVDISKEIILQKNSPIYNEYLLPIEHDQIEPAHDTLDLFVNKKTEGLKELFLARGEFEHIPSSSYNLKQPYLGGFFIGDDEYWLVEAGREYQEQSGRDIVWWEATTDDMSNAHYQLYKNGELADDLTYIFSRPLCYGLDGFEGMIEDIHLINEKLTFQFLDGECMNNPKSNLFVQGKLVNEIYSTDESKYYFSLGTTEGFIGKKLNQEYIYIDGQPASMNFDSIIISSCCMSPRPYIRMFEDGTIFFLGIRNKQFYLGEIHSQISETKTQKLKLEDKNTFDFTEISNPNLKLPSDIHPAQIKKYFRFNDQYYALVMQPSINVPIDSIPPGFQTKFVGILSADLNNSQWEKQYQISNSIDHQFNPYYLFLIDNKLSLTIVDSDGAGSGEGTMAVLTNSQSEWETIGCYYFGLKYKDYDEDGDYLFFSTKLDLQRRKDLNECGSVNLLKIN